MPLQKQKKKKAKPASDKSVKQVVTQVVKVNIGDTKPKKKRKRKTGGGVARSAAPPPMLAQVPQQFIYPPQSFPQEAPMAPPRQAPPSIEVPAPVPVSALNRVLGSVPRSTLATQTDEPRSTLKRSMSERPKVTTGFVGQPPPIPQNTPAPKISPPPSIPNPFGIEPSLSAPPLPRDAPMVTVGRDSGKDTLVEPPMMMPNPDDPPPVGRSAPSDKLVGFDPSVIQAKAEKALRGREATRRSRSRSKSRDPNDPPKMRPGPKPGSKNKVSQVPGQQGIRKYIPGQAEDLGQPNF